MILNPGAKFLVVDVKKFYLNNAISKHGYYNISLSLIYQDVIDEYNLVDKQIDRFFYVRAEKGMYGLVQEDIIAHTALR